MCCTLPPLHTSTTCLPTFIVAGTQKSGTTAAAALLSTSPSISFSKKKEPHFFDVVSKYRQGLTKYLTYFHPWNTSRPHPPVYGESTPFYVASRHACARIAATLPNVRIILLLREPVARAYSEYQMKRRRVEAQNTFIALAEQHASALYACLAANPWKWTTLKACLPPEVAAHVHVAKFMVALRNLAKKATGGGWPAMLKVCFPVAARSRKRRLLSRHRLRNRHSLRLFAADACLGKYARETLAPLGEAFGQELRAFERCGGALVVHPTATLAMLDAAVDTCLNVTKGISRHYFYRSLYAAQLYRCFQHIPRDRVLVLGANELEHRPQHTLQRMLAFVGVASPSFDAAPTVGIDGTTITEAVKRSFPTFEAATGWQLRSIYAPLPDGLRDELRAFFAPYNRLLSQLLGSDALERAWSVAPYMNSTL